MKVIMEKPIVEVIEESEAVAKNTVQMGCWGPSPDDIGNSC